MSARDFSTSRWFKGTKRTKAIRRRNSRISAPLLEAFENRLLPSTIVLNPTGGGDPTDGSQAGNLFNVSSITYNDGSALAIGGNQAAQNFVYNQNHGTSLDTTFTLVFQSVIVGIQGSNDTGSTISIVPDVPLGVSTSGDIKINEGSGGTNDTMHEITTVGHLTEEVTNVTTSGTGRNAKTTATFNLVDSSTNTVSMYYLPMNSANESTGMGFTGATPILTGHVLTDNYLSSFTSSATTTKFDGYTQTGYTSPFATTGPSRGPEQTIKGGGITQFLVQVTSTDPGFFVSPPFQTIALSFNPISAVLPFGQAPPAQSVYGHSVVAGTQGVGIGQVNGSTTAQGGPDTEFQTGATFRRPAGVTLPAVWPPVARS
jgi:hypothetical protein